MAKMGRPTEFDQNKAEIILDAMARGHFLAVAAPLAGVSRTTVWNWLQKGKAEPEGIFRDFLNAYKRAEAQAIDKALAAILGLATAEDGQLVKVTDWQRFAWFLERRKPKDWGRRTLIEDKRKTKPTKTETAADVAEEIREFLQLQNEPPPGESPTDLEPV